MMKAVWPGNATMQASRWCPGGIYACMLTLKSCVSELKTAGSARRFQLKVAFELLE